MIDESPTSTTGNILHCLGKNICCRHCLIPIRGGIYTMLGGTAVYRAKAIRGVSWHRYKITTVHGIMEHI